jgi:hypothetical protein
VLQGVSIPAGAIDPKSFKALTRRKRNVEKSTAFAGLGQTDTFELKKSDIIAGLHIRFSGTLTIALNAGTVATTLRWPYDLAKAIKFTANGQSNIINSSGTHLKAREMMTNKDVTDRGVVQTVGGSLVQNGTLALDSESWGVGAGTSAIAGGTYNVELYWFVPVAEDLRDLTGAILAQTTTMDLTLSIDWAAQTDLFTTTGAPTITLAGSVIIESLKFSIPQINGVLALPDLSVYHSIIKNRNASLVNGENEVKLTGQGAGKRLLRTWFQVWNGSPSAPLAATATNYGVQGWRYGTNETPEQFADGRSLRQYDESIANSDYGAVFGILCHEFAATDAFRDVVNMAETSELRLVVGLQSGVVLNAPVCEYSQETVFSAVKSS